MVASETSGNITRPPNRSVSAPTGIRPSEPTTTGTATSRATSDSDSRPSVPSVRNSGPSGLSSAQAQKFTAKPAVATASINHGDRLGPDTAIPSADPATLVRLTSVSVLGRAQPAARRTPVPGGLVEPPSSGRP